jgi:glycosyltransferase involved in cell wall biosynthesis
MIILHFIPSLSGGGAERQLSYLAPELARMGHNVHIAYSGEGPDRPELPDVILHQLTSRSNYDPFLLWQLVRLIHRIRPDIIHTWIVQMDILGGIAARLCGIPWLFREPSSQMAYSPTWKHRLRVLVASGASAIVSNSRGGDEYWRTRAPCSRRYIVTNGLPLSEIERSMKVLPLGLLKPDLPIVLYAGRLASDGSATKNLKALLEALVLVRQKLHISAIICGEGPQRTELEALRHNLGLDECVYFTGNLPATRVWAVMKKASVFVSLSAYEGCPNTVIEAMACGCPLVISDIPAHREILDESCALFTDPANVQQTADVIMQVLSDAKTSQERASIARRKIGQWSVAEMAHNYDRIYREVVSSHFLKAGRRYVLKIDKRNDV